MSKLMIGISERPTYWKTTLETYGVYVTRKSANKRSVKSYQCHLVLIDIGRP